ncbi:hypothetical protein C8F04DRAFT_1276682 [Mycena alexandri]|uniref:Uncharacterized protein n=1 Tax=Mycena alexandri TaxID=1745969 RepID=A0AAD6S261_9AGAR|nr:hypothetical protein C8F04DRAFT_1276682 [Mycena alexandri]
MNNAVDEGTNFVFTMNVNGLSQEEFLSNFWTRVGRLSARSHLSNKRWVGAPELKEWSEANPQPCGRCSISKKPRTCRIEHDHPSCQTCRKLKLSCDRRARYVFDNTKDEFFQDFEEFLKVFSCKPPTTLRAGKKAESRMRRKVIEALTPTSASGPSKPKVEPVSLCVSCLQTFVHATSQTRTRDSSETDSSCAVSSIINQEDLQEITGELLTAKKQILATRGKLLDRLAQAGVADTQNAHRHVIRKLIQSSEHYESANMDLGLFL